MKTFVGPRLRRLRSERGQTQSEMAKALGISTSYVNLLEKNERSISVGVLLKLFEAYGVDWRDISDDEQTKQLADLRAALQDPLFEGARPDLPQLRAALVHCPDLATSLLTAHAAYQELTERVLSGAGGDGVDLAASTPEALVHGFFRKRDNYFAPLEEAADTLTEAGEPERDEVYSWAKARLREDFGISVRLNSVTDQPQSLRRFDAKRREIHLSEALDYPNRIFQLLHVRCLVQCADILDELIREASISDDRGRARCRVELANYFAAAALMPYDRFHAEALASKYDFDHLATRFGVSFEQACHRAITLRRPGAAGIPLFFFRIDHAGNVTKRFNSADFVLAELGGACPRLNVHTCFRTPGRVVTQLVEMPDSSRYIVCARTVDRPSTTRMSQDKRLAVAIGCAEEYAGSVGYADGLSLATAAPTEIGINCRVCPRAHCDQRAQQALVANATIDENLRGTTKFDY